MVADRLWIRDFLRKSYDSVDAIDFYRDVFPEGILQEKGTEHYGDGRYCALLMTIGSSGAVKRRSVTDDLDVIKECVKHQQNPDVSDGDGDMVILAPVSYIGKAKDSQKARQLFGMVFDLDGIEEEKHLQELIYQIEKIEILPRPTYIVFSGGGVHLWYLFEAPVNLYEVNIKELQKLKHDLTRRIWNRYSTVLYENVQYQGIFQSFRVVGTRTKGGNVTEAFGVGDRVTIEYLNEFVDERQQANISGCKYPESSMTLEEAREKYPEWYQRRIVEKVPPKSWVANRAVYDNWLDRIQTGGICGHRYFQIFLLAVYGIKCRVDFETVKKDAEGLLPYMESLTMSDDNHFSSADVEAALKGYDEKYIRMGIDTIASLSGLEIKATKRNGRTRAEHVKIMNFIRDEVNGNKNWQGRKSKEDIVKKWRKRNPDGTKAQCIRETGLSKPTVYKHWENTEPEGKQRNNANNKKNIMKNKRRSAGPAKSD